MAQNPQGIKNLLASETGRLLHNSNAGYSKLSSRRYILPVSAGMAGSAVLAS